MTDDSIEIPAGMFASKEEEAEVKKSIYNRQDEGERRQIREGYRSFMDALTESKEELIDPSNKDDLLSQKLSVVDTMFRKVKMTREGALDSASLVRLADLGKMRAQALKTDFITFNAADFTEKVRLTIGGDTDPAMSGDLSATQWSQLGAVVAPGYRRTPVITFMCGAFERGEVTLKRSKPREREKDKDANSEKVTKVTQLSSLDETDRGELTTAQVDHLLNTLWRVYENNEKNPICFFEFIVNPFSFGHTVENIFYASFLVRDGHAKIILDNDELPTIEPIEKSDNEGRDTERVQRHQVVISLTQEEWKEIVETFGITDALIKPIDIQQPIKDRNQQDNIPQATPGGDKGKGKGKGKGKKSIVTP